MLQNNLDHKNGIQITKKVKYLGIVLSNRLSTLYEDNYEKILREMEQDLKKWENLQILLLGRIATIKMSVLPRLLFFFQTIPIRLGIFFF